MSNLTRHELFALELQRGHTEQLTEANDHARRTQEMLNIALKENARLTDNNTFLKELTVKQQDQLAKLKLTVRGAAVIGFLAGALVATIITTYAIWATNTL